MSLGWRLSFFSGDKVMKWVHFMNQTQCPLCEMTLFLFSCKSVHFSCINSPCFDLDSSRIPCLCAWKRITSVKITQKGQLFFAAVFIIQSAPEIYSRVKTTTGIEQADWATVGIGLLQNASPHPLFFVKSKNKQRNRRGWTTGHLSKMTMATISQAASCAWNSKEIQPPSDWDGSFVCYTYTQGRFKVHTCKTAWHCFIII